MSQAGMTPPTSDLQPRAAVPRWIGVGSIILGVVGLLCWGGQGATMLLTDAAELEASGLSLSPGHQAMAVVGYVANTLLAVLLLVAGVRSLNGDGQGVGLLRGWAWLKLLSVCVGLVTVFLYYDELLQMNEGMIREEMVNAAQEGAEEAEAAPIDEDWVKVLGRGMTIGSVAIGSVVQAIWPIIVLAVTRGRDD